MGDDAAKQAAQLYECIHQLDAAYESYAKSVGLNYMSIYVLYMVSLRECCTQKELSEELYLPKQTVNTVVRSFQRQGLMEMLELPTDRRHKAIHLTEKGNAYAAKVLPKIEQAETNSMGQLAPEERKQLLELLERYRRSFAKELKG